MSTTLHETVSKRRLVLFMTLLAIASSYLQTVKSNVKNQRFLGKRLFFIYSRWSKEPSRLQPVKDAPSAYLLSVLTIWWLLQCMIAKRALMPFPSRVFDYPNCRSPIRVGNCEQIIVSSASHKICFIWSCEPLIWLGHTPNNSYSKKQPLSFGCIDPHWLSLTEFNSWAFILLRSKGWRFCIRKFCSILKAYIVSTSATWHTFKVETNKQPRESSSTELPAQVEENKVKCATAIAIQVHIVNMLTFSVNPHAVQPPTTQLTHNYCSFSTFSVSLGFYASHCRDLLPPPEHNYICR